jgi:hypothetical protein
MNTTIENETTADADTSYLKEFRDAALATYRNYENTRYSNQFLAELDYLEESAIEAMTAECNGDAAEAGRLYANVRAFKASALARYEALGGNTDLLFDGEEDDETYEGEIKAADGDLKEAGIAYAEGAFLHLANGNDGPAPTERGEAMIELYRAISEQDGIIDNDRERLIMAEAVYPVFQSRREFERQGLAEDIQHAIDVLKAGNHGKALHWLSFLRGNLAAETT